MLPSTLLLLMAATWSPELLLRLEHPTPVESGAFGLDAISPGDVNGDGRDDLVVSTINQELLLYLGGETGLSSTPAAVFTSPADRPWYGFRLRAAGDINGDGFGDVLVAAGAPIAYYKTSGSVYVYWGSASGLNSSPTELTSPAAAWGDGFGFEPAAGDLDGDGYSDVIAAGGGILYVFPGSAEGIQTEEVYRLVAEKRLAERPRILDVDGDGDQEVLTLEALGDTGGAEIVTFDGLAAGDEMASGEHGSAWFELFDSEAGDLNHDGFGDFWYFDGSSLTLYQGSGTGSFTSSRHSTAIGAKAPSYLQGDLDGDGHPELVSWGLTNSSTLEQVHVFKGGPSAELDKPLVTIDNPQPERGYFGIRPGPSGDFDGDGVHELVVAARFDDPGGAVYIYTLKCEQPWYPDADGDGFGSGPAVLSCEAPAEGSWAAEEGDCDDSDSGVHPSATEIPGDGIDNDCDGEDTLADTAPQDSGESPDSPEPQDSDAVSDADDPPASNPPQSCGCQGLGSTAGGGLVGLGLLLLLGWRRRSVVEV